MPKSAASHKHRVQHWGMGFIGKSLLEKVLETSGLMLQIKDTKKRIPLNQGERTAWEPPKPLSTLNYVPKPRKSPVDIVLANLKVRLRDDLIGFIGQAKPAFRVLTAGGYGLKTLLETKHKMFGMVQTTDLDLTVSTRNATMTPKQAYAHWMDQIDTFIQSQQDSHKFAIKTVNFDGEFIPVLGYHRYYVIIVTYKGGDFLDVAFTDLDITDSSIERAASFQSGIPLKTEEAYLKEFMTMIYMENVPGVNEYCYAKRNPVTGKFTGKGMNDIKRSKLICRVSPTTKYGEYCELLKGLNEGSLKAMPRKQRDTYFKPIGGILGGS